MPFLWTEKFLQLECLIPSSRVEKNLEKISKHEITPYRALCEEFGVTFLLTMYSLSFYIIFSYFPLFYNKKQFSSASKQWDNKVVSDFERFPANFYRIKRLYRSWWFGQNIYHYSATLDRAWPKERNHCKHILIAKPTNFALITKIRRFQHLLETIILNTLSCGQQSTLFKSCPHFFFYGTINSVQCPKIKISFFWQYCLVHYLWWLM